MECVLSDEGGLTLSHFARCDRSAARECWPPAAWFRFGSARDLTGCQAASSAM